MEIEVHGAFGDNGPTGGPDGHRYLIGRGRVGLGYGDDDTVDIECDTCLWADSHDLLRDDAILHVESNGDIFAGGSGILEGQEFGEFTGRIAVCATVGGNGGGKLTC